MVTFKGAWQEIESGSKSKIMAKLKYVAHIAYHDLVMNHQYLSSSVLLVDVLEDLSIVVPLTSREEMEEFRTEIERILCAFLSRSELFRGFDYYFLLFLIHNSQNFLKFFDYLQLYLLV